MFCVVCGLIKVSSDTIPDNDIWHKYRGQEQNLLHIDYACWYIIWPVALRCRQKNARDINTPGIDNRPTYVMCGYIYLTQSNILLEYL